MQRLPVMRLGTPVSTVPTMTVSRSSNSGQFGAGTPPLSAMVNDTCFASEVLPALSVARWATVW